MAFCVCQLKQTLNSISLKSVKILRNIDETIDGLPITNEHTNVRNETLNDSTLKSVLFYVQNSKWPKPSRFSSDLIVF